MTAELFLSLLCLLCLCTSESTSAEITANLTLPRNSSSNLVILFENESYNLHTSMKFFISAEDLNQSLMLKCWLEDVKVGTLKNWTDLHLPSPLSEVFIKDLNVTVEAKRLGGSRVLCSVSMTIEGNKTSNLFEGEMAYLVVKRVTTIPEVIFRYCVIFFIVFLTFVMGCDLDRRAIWGYVKQPVSPAIGFACQFLLMPLMSFGLAKVTNIDNAFGFGLLTIGCSPGGGASNVWTVLFGGDLNLSMTMTCISSCAALFMMPFWLFVLGRFFIDPTVVSIPFLDIGLNLLQVVLPIIAGMLFRWKFLKLAILLTRRIKLFGLIFIIFILSFGSYANLYIFKLMGDYPALIGIGACLPWLGFASGYLMALATRRTQSEAIAISLETGFQNIGIALLILRFSMPQPGGDLGAVMPIVVALFTPLPLYIALAILTIKRKYCGHEKERSIIEVCQDNAEEQHSFLELKS